MAPIKFSKSHEREEARLLRKGFVRSWIGLLLCWLPVAGLLFAIGGFVRTIVRLTRKYRVRRRIYLAFSFLVLTVCISALMGEIWIYSRDPGVLDRLGSQAWTFMTGQNADPISTPAPGSGTNYTDMDTAGLGVTSPTGELQEESDGLSEGDIEDWQTWDENFDWESWEDSEEWSDAEADDSLVWDAELDDADFWTEEDDWFFEDDANLGDESVFNETFGDESIFGESSGSGEDGDAFADEGLDWLDEDEDGIIWLDENGQPLPPETTLRVGPGEAIVAPK